MQAPILIKIYQWLILFLLYYNAIDYFMLNQKINFYPQHMCQTPLDGLLYTRRSPSCCDMLNQAWFSNIVKNCYKFPSVCALYIVRLLKHKKHETPSVFVIFDYYHDFYHFHHNTIMIKLIGIFTRNRTTSVRKFYCLQ